MPALVNSKVGSSAGTNDEEGTSRCPLATKNSRNSRRMWDDFMPGNISQASLAYHLAHHLADLVAGESAAGEIRQHTAAPHFAG